MSEFARFVSKITIVTLTYNNHQDLGACIKSVSTQNISEEYEVEYLIVDDGSEEFDFQYVNSLCESLKVPYRIIVNEKNMGTVASFNGAINVSSGDIIIPLSADDVFYDAHVVNDIANEFNARKSLILTGFRVPNLEATSLVKLPGLNQVALFSDQKRLLNYLVVKGNCISGACISYHKNVFTDIGLFDENYRLLEDRPFYIKALLHGKHIDFFDRNIIRFGVNGVSNIPNQTVRSDLKKLYLSILTTYNFSFFDKRYFIYNFPMDRSNKIKFYNDFLYPEQYAIFIIKQVLSFFKSKNRNVVG